MKYTFPGFIDLHVHFRDPGVPEAETTASGLEAARRGGFAAVVVMPNTTPPIDTPERVKAQLQGLSPQHGGQTPRLFTSACITENRGGERCAPLEELADAGAVFFTDDGTYVSNAKVMKEAMRRAYELNMVVSQHALATGISEADCIRRDLSLVRETGCRLHVQHISTATGVELVREAIKEGLPVTAEATPHPLLLTADDIPACDNLSTDRPSSFFKMAPPLATKEDRAELRKAVKDGLFMFATDHAPHPISKKLVPYKDAANGIIGLETAIPITYHVMVEEEGMSIEDWAKAWYKLPRELLGLKDDTLKPTTIETELPRKVEVNSFASLSRNCPYDGLKFNAWPLSID